MKCFISNPRKWKCNAWSIGAMDSYSRVPEAEVIWVLLCIDAIQWNNHEPLRGCCCDLGGPGANRSTPSTPPIQRKTVPVGLLTDLHSERAHPARLLAWSCGCLWAEARLSTKAAVSLLIARGEGQDRHHVIREALKGVLWAHIAASCSTGQNWPQLAAEGSFPPHQRAVLPCTI